MNDPIQKKPTLLLSATKKAAPANPPFHASGHQTDAGRFSVATVDMDGRQGTLSKYLENRETFCARHKISLPIPVHYKFSPQEDYGLIPADRANIRMQISKLLDNYDAVIIDTPGTKNYLFEEAHRFADTLITPISDSLIDLNVLADIDFENEKSASPVITPTTSGK